MTHLASGYRSPLNHIVADSGTTRCGKPTTGMAVWPIALTPRTSPRRLCEACRSAK